MDLKLLVLVVLVAQSWAATIKTKNGPTKRVMYQEGLQTMWMTDETGKLVEVFLTQKGEESTSNNNLLTTSVAANVLFYLYTPESDSAYEIYKDDLETLQSSTFDVTRPTKVLIHGFNNKYTSDSEQLIRQAFLQTSNVNVIAVDWSALCKSPNYFSAVSHVKPVGQQVALLIDFLVSAGADVSTFHILGHSLGAHVSSFAANYVTSGNISRITGLDPALPLYAGRAASKRLDPSDADIVDCVHTCGGLLGYYNPLCTHDFYPNGGSPSQPGCSWDLTGACSHGMSYKYFAAAIRNTGSFTAQSCASTAEVKSAKCSGVDTALLGVAAAASNPGIYYLKTSKTYPYYES